MFPTAWRVCGCAGAMVVLPLLFVTLNMHRLAGHYPASLSLLDGVWLALVLGSGPSCAAGLPVSCRARCILALLALPVCLLLTFIWSAYYSCVMFGNCM